MDKQLQGKVIVITGASSGFGKGVALQFARRGASLVLAARRGDLLEALAHECEQFGARVSPVTTDVSAMADMEKLTQTALSQHAVIDVWINDAGTAAIGAFADVPLLDHIKVVETDLMGTMYGSYFALKQFLKQNRGTLINIASMIGKVPAPYYASYAAAKHGVVGLSAAIRQELKAQNAENIHVCTVLPMAMDTPFFEHASNYSGCETVPIPPLDDAEKVINEIVNLVFKPKGEIPVGIGSGSNIFLHNFAPALSEFMMGKITHKAQIEDAPLTAPTTGAVMQPSSFGTGIKDPKLQRR